VPDAPVLPSAEELAALPHEELAARLADAYRLISELSARVERLERDSSTSSRPSSSDSPYKKKPARDRSLREKGKRAPGRQPGEPGPRLVETGLIGTTGTSTQVLYDQITLSFEGHKSLVATSTARTCHSLSTTVRNAYSGCGSG
jgi:hypothetical protein